MWRETAQQLMQSQLAEARFLNSNQAAFATSQAQIGAGLVKLSDIDTQLAASASNQASATRGLAAAQTALAQETTNLGTSLRQTFHQGFAQAASQSRADTVKLQTQVAEVAGLAQETTNLVASLRQTFQQGLAEAASQSRADTAKLQTQATEVATLAQETTNLVASLRQTFQQGLAQAASQSRADTVKLQTQTAEVAGLAQETTNLVASLRQTFEQGLAEAASQSRADTVKLQTQAAEVVVLAQETTNLMASLRQTFQQDLQQKEQQVQTFRQELQQKEQQAQTFRRELQQKEQQTAQLAQQRTSLQQQFDAAQTNIQTLSQQLQSSSTEALISKEKLAAMRAELQKQAEQAAALQQQLGHLAQSNQVVLTEKQRLAGQLQVAETEKRMATEQVGRMQDEVKVERAEKAKLAEGVMTLAARSDQLAQVIQQNRPLAPNRIFSQFVTNRVQATIRAVRSGFLGMQSGKRTETQTVLVTDGTNTVALCHVQDTPLNFSYPGMDWEGLTGVLGRNQTTVPIRSLSFYQLDPRVVFIPVTEAEAQQLGGTAYRTSSDPFKFQDAVLVGAQEGYYGECTFQIDLTTPLYVKMDRNSLKGLFGKFNPSRGDLVFSRTGELLGVMANSTYCMMMKSFNPTATFDFAQDVRSQQPGETLARLYSLIAKLPSRLQ
ncbi:MAG: hypothetical protein ACLQU3_17740 [Limisphaerales bacterium]